MLLEQGTLQGFTGEVSKHVLCWTILDGQIVLFNAVRDKEIPDVEVSSASGSAVPSIGFQ